MCGILMRVSDNEDTAAQSFADALVGEIWAEMGRQGIRSVRALAEKMGVPHTPLNDRLNKSSRTGKRVAIGQDDLWRICEALGVQPWEIVRRAGVTMSPPPIPQRQSS